MFRMRHILRKGVALFIEQLPLADVQYFDKVLHSYLYTRTDKSSGRISEEILDRLYWELLPSEWAFLAPPVRPSKEDLSFYAQTVQERPEKAIKVLILGSTPELREIIAVRGYTHNKVYIADLSYRHLIEDAVLGEHIDTDKENWLKENWLELPFTENYFDIILGDLVLQQMRPEQERAFLGCMQRILKKEGIFITRAHFLAEECREGNVQSIVDEIEKLPISINEKFFATKLRLLWISSDAHKRTFNRQKVYEDFKKFIERNPQTPPYLKRVEKNLSYYRNSNRNWSPPNKEGLYGMFTENFTLRAQYLSRDHVCAKYYPIFVLAPK